MSAHVQVQPSGHEFFVDGNDSLLEAALRAGLSLDYGCSIGNCGKCKARLVSGQVHRLRHSDYALTAAEKAAGVVLMCCHTAATDAVIEAREAHGAADMPLQTIDTRVKGVSAMGEDMRLLHLQTPRTQRLRDAFINHNGEQPNNRAILKAMQDKWPDRKVDNKTLFDLYPGNPSKQAGKVAGLPESMRKGGY